MKIFLQGEDYELWGRIIDGPTIPIKLVEREQVKKVRSEFTANDLVALKKNDKAKKWTRARWVYVTTQTETLSVVSTPNHEGLKHLYLSGNHAYNSYDKKMRKIHHTTETWS